MGEPAEKDYAAARSYLSLLLADLNLDEAVQLLRDAPEGKWRAKDILRAANLPLLKAKQSAEVAEKVKHVSEGVPISPVLLIHNGAGHLEIADGYHRVCAACLSDEDVLVPARLALYRLLALR